MGQYGNQPDFGTRAAETIPAGNADSPVEDTTPLKSAALYIGTGGTLVCNVVVGNYNLNGVPNTTTFQNIPNGTFLPIIVSNIWADDTNGKNTSCDNIVAIY